MRTNSDYQFVPTDPEEIAALLTQTYEHLTGTTVHPASPERLFIQWVASILVQERALTNYAANQNIPSRAEGPNLDALAELTNCRPRPEAQRARCTMRFYISQAQAGAVLIPAGTRVTDAAGAMVWATLADAYIPIGETSIDLPVVCQTAGTAGNGFLPGQISTTVDIYDYYSGCANITASGGGADRATDDEYYALMRASMDSYSCAGSRGGYIYHAMQVSTEIADVAAVSPAPGTVKLYVLMQDGKIAGDEVKAAVLAACSAEDVRPLTDLVTVEDPAVVDYNIAFTYYVPDNASVSGQELAAAVQAAADRYAAWQCAKLGRDINPSYLIGLLMQTGIKRVDLTAPVFTVLRDGGDKSVPQVARLGTVAITNGGSEHE